MLYSRYADQGYAEIKQTVLDNGKIIYDRRWTQIGREFLLKLYESERQGLDLLHELEMTHAALMISNIGHYVDSPQCERTKAVIAKATKGGDSR